MKLDSSELMKVEAPELVKLDPPELRRSLFDSHVALAIVLIMVAASLAVTFPAGFRYAVFPQDEGLLLTYPEQLLHSSIPNLDFQSVYGPTNLVFVALAFKLVGHSIVVERMVGAGYRLILVLCLTTIVWRLRGAVVAGCAGFISVVLMGGVLGLAAYAWFAGLALSAFAFLLLGTDFLHEGMSPSRRQWRPVVAGICLGLAVGSRADLVIAVLLVTVAIAITNRRVLWPMIAGVLVGLVPMLINVALAGLSNVVSGEIIQPVFISDPGRKIAFSTLSGYEQLLFLLCLITAVGLTFRGAMAFARQRERSSAYLLVIGAFELGILPEAFERTDLSHLALVSCFIVPTLLLILFPRTTWSWRGLWQTIGLGAVTALILVAAWPSFGNVYQGAVSAWTSFPTYDVTNDGRTVPVASRPEQELLQRLLRTVDSHSRAGQKVFIGPADLRTANYNDTFLYFLLPKLTPGTFYLEMDPGVANAKNSHLAHDISQDHIVILDYFDNVVARDADPRTRYGPNLPNSIVHTKFSRVGTFGPWSLYLRR